MFSEKTERKIKIGINCFAIFAVVLLVITLWSHSKYSPNDHSAEQGHLPVYVNPPGQTSTNINNTPADGDNATNEPTTPEDFFANFDAKRYGPMDYEDVSNACSKGKKEYVKVQGTVYSVLETSTNTVYSIADKDGNYYSLVDMSGGQLPKFKQRDIMIVYGETYKISKMNGQDIPQLYVAFFEAVE